MTKDEATNDDQCEMACVIRRINRPGALRPKSTKIIVDMNDLSEFKAFAEAPCRAGAPIARHYFRSDAATSGTIDKPDATPVTLADMAIEQRLRDETAVYPAHGILGEEHDSVNLGAEWVWVIDPIDGTKAFILRQTAVRHVDRALAPWRAGGGRDRSANHRGTLDGRQGRGSWFNGQPVRANAQVKPLAETIVLVTTPDQFTGAGAAAFER